MSCLVFLCKHLTSWFNEHLRSYELCSHVPSKCHMSVNMLSDLNDPFPLAAYRIRGRTFVTLRHYILCWLDAEDFDVKCHEVTQLIFICIFYTLCIIKANNGDEDYTKDTQGYTFWETPDTWLQYEDPDFNNTFVNLTDITDLPDKPTLKIITLVSTPTPSTASTDDTEILPFSPESRSYLSRSPWPDTFDIPNFPVDIEYRLRQGNLPYMRDKTYLQVSRDMKHEILEKLAEAIYTFKAYPCDEEFMMLQQHWFKSTHASLNQALSLDVMDGK